MFCTADCTGDADPLSINTCRSSLSRYSVSIRLHVAVVFLDGAREAVVSLIVADEVEQLRLGRMQRRLKRRYARVRDGPRGQSGVLVGVVRRIRLQIGDVDDAVVTAGKLRRVDHAGIGGERDA